MFSVRVVLGFLRIAPGTNAVDCCSTETRTSGPAVVFPDFSYLGEGPVTFSSFTLMPAFYAPAALPLHLR